MSEYGKNVQQIRRTAQQANQKITDADKLLLEGKLATASGTYESAAGLLRRSAQLTRDAIVEREIEREEGIVSEPTPSPKTALEGDQ